MLLAALLQALPSALPVVLQADLRMPQGEQDARIEVRRIAPTLGARLGAEKWLARHATAHDQVLCFGNLPPLYKLAAHVSVLVQNRHLVEKSDLRGFPLSVRLRLLLERQWLSRRLSHCNEILVQSASMARLVQQNFGNPPTVRILPFVQPASSVPSTTHPVAQMVDFIYVASGEPNKNHVNLLEAWRLLAQDGLRPSLRLTIDRVRYARLAADIERTVARHDLKISNLGTVKHDDVAALYQQARALIYPSTLESFGIPLLEAQQAGIDILASELDYVRDLLDPVQAFDPASPVSIARAVRRYLGRPDQRYVAVSADAFLQAVLLPKLSS